MDTTYRLKLATRFSNLLRFFVRYDSTLAREEIERLVREHMPSGSGFDAGTTLNFERSTPEKLVFDTAYHHMSEHGFYCGWTDHRVTVTPSFDSGYNLRVSGRDRNDTKSYIEDTFRAALSREVEVRPLNANSEPAR